MNGNTPFNVDRLHEKAESIMRCFDFWQEKTTNFLFQRKDQIDASHQQSCFHISHSEVTRFFLLVEGNYSSAT